MHAQPVATENFGDFQLFAISVELNTFPKIGSFWKTGSNLGLNRLSTCSSWNRFNSEPKTENWSETLDNFILLTKYSPSKNTFFEQKRYVIIFKILFSVSEKKAIFGSNSVKSHKNAWSAFFFNQYIQISRKGRGHLQKIFYIYLIVINLCNFALALV